MARGKRRSKPTKKTPKKRTKKTPSPEDIRTSHPDIYYITADPGVSLRMVADQFDMSISTISKRAMNEKWTRRRKEFWERTEAKVIEALEGSARQEIIKANKRHIKLGQASQGVGGKALGVASTMLDDKNADIKPGEALRAGAQAIKAGVDVERKGLGLADKVLYIQGVRQFAQIVIVAVSQVIGGQPDLLEETIRVIQEKVDEAEKSGEVLEAQFEEID